MAMHNLAPGSKSRLFLRNEDLVAHHVLLSRCLWDDGRSYLRSLSLTPKLATDAGITPTSRVAVFWEDQQRLLILKVLNPTGGRPTQTRKPRFAAGDVVQVSDLGWVSPELEALYFPNSPTGSKRRYQHDCQPQIVPNPDGNEIHIYPPSPPGTQPDPEDDEVEFGQE